MFLTVKYILINLTENAATPYSATVLINDMQYGTGVGSSKKAAKAEVKNSSRIFLIRVIYLLIDHRLPRLRLKYLSRK